VVGSFSSTSILATAWQARSARERSIAFASYRVPTAQAGHGRERQVNPDARLWHPWLRLQRLPRDIRGPRWDDETWTQIKPEIRNALARNRVQRAEWFQLTPAVTDVPSDGEAASAASESVMIPTHHHCSCAVAQGSSG